jgi:5-oxoprolinase (ATP-hydrolysing)
MRVGTGFPGSSHGWVLQGQERHRRSICDTSELVTLRSDQEIVEVSLSGGAGFGDPRARPLAAVVRDLAEGFISAEGAARDYGAVVGIDAAASERWRQLGTAAE